MFLTKVGKDFLDMTPQKAQTTKEKINKLQLYQSLKVFSLQRFH